jgi:hypothetical protein
VCSRARFVGSVGAQGLRSAGSGGMGLDLVRIFAETFFYFSGLLNAPPVGTKDLGLRASIICARTIWHGFGSSYFAYRSYWWNNCIFFSFGGIWGHGKFGSLFVSQGDLTQGLAWLRLVPRDLVATCKEFTVAV